MAQDIVLDAQPRTDKGTGVAKKLRAAGRLPGVIYGPGMPTRPVTLGTHELIRALHAHGVNALVTLRVDGDEQLAIVKDLQVDPVRLEALHVDFLAVRADVEVQTVAQIVLVGEPEGVKLGGGVLETQLDTVSIAALPRSIPETIELDVSGLGMGDVIRVQDLQAPEGVTILTDLEETIASVTAPRVAEAAEEEVEAAEGEEAAAEGDAEGETQASSEES